VRPSAGEPADAVVHPITTSREAAMERAHTMTARDDAPEANRAHTDTQVSTWLRIAYVDSAANAAKSGIHG